VRRFGSPYAGRVWYAIIRPSVLLKPSEAKPIMRSRLFKGTSGVLNISMGNRVLCVLMLAVMLLGGIVIYRSVEVQKRVATTFVGWYEDQSGYDKALVDQKTTHKPMLVYFYASWCPHCKRFSAEVLSDAKMRQFVQDYPHVRIAPDNGNPEKQLMKQYGAPGYPAFYVLMPDQKRRQIETFIMGPQPRMKTPLEFMKSILQATGAA
jgi:thiol:disulfide interchange protein